MRTRTDPWLRGGCHVSSSSCYYKNDTGAIFPRSSPVSISYNDGLFNNLLTERFEVASDLSNINTRDRWNSFEHYLRSFEVPQGAGIPIACGNFLASGYYHDKFSIYSNLWGYPESYVWGPPDNPTGGLPGLYNSGLGDGHFVPYPTQIDDIVAHALAVLLPQIRPNLSILNSIYELKDFRSLPRTIARAESALFYSWNWASLKLVILAFLGKGKYLPLKELIKRVVGAGSDVYLQAQFNIGPLLSDIAGIQRSLLTVEKEMVNLLHHEGQVMRRHFASDIAGLYGGEGWQDYLTAYADGGNFSKIRTAGNCDGAPINGNIHGTFKTSRQTHYESAKFHAEIEYIYYLSQFQREHGYILSLLDKFGVFLNPSIVWNAIPWTFVVDWVLSVSSWLNQFKVSNMEPVTYIRRFLYSIRVARSTTVFVKNNIGITHVGSCTYQAARVHETAYRRTSGLHQAAQSLQTSGLNLKEFTLSAALGGSRLNPRRPRLWR